MAEESEQIFITIKVDDRELRKEATTLKELKIARKQYTDEAIRGNKEALKSLAQVNDKLEDIGEATNTLKGSGVERLTSSFRLLGEGLATFDFDKIKVGFQGLGAAMKAVPIFLLIEGVRLLIENFDKVTALFKSGASASEVLTKQLEQQKLANDALIAVYEGEIAILEAKGKQEDKIFELKNKILQQRKIDAKTQLELNLLKREEVLFDNQTLVNAIKEAERRVSVAKSDAERIQAQKTLVNLQKQLKEETLEADKEISKAQIEFAGAEAQLQVTAIKYQNEKNKAIEEEGKKRKEAYDKLKNSLSGAFNADDPELAAEASRFDARIKAQEDFNARKEKIAQEEIKITADRVREETELERKAAEESARIIELESQLKKDLAAKGLSTLEQLSDTYFQNQLIAAQGNSEAETEIRKKQFQVEKAFRIGNIVIDTAGNLVKTTAQLGGLGAITPAGIAILSGITALGVAQAAIVNAAKFDGGSASVPNSGGVSSGSAPAAPPPPPQFANSNENQTVLTNTPSGRVEAYVVESQLSTTQRRVRRIERQSRFGI